LQPFATHFRAEQTQACDIAARLRKTRDKSKTNRIDTRHDDGNCGCLLPRRAGRLRSCRKDDIDLGGNQLGRELGQPVRLPGGASVVNDEVLALDITEIT
jgi:hypothetical protein